VQPGPQGNANGDTLVMNFSGRYGAGIAGAVNWFIDPVAARGLVAKLRGADGTIPRYYQVLLKIRYQDRVPVETSYVLHRDLSPR
jgi:hypothetical protein